MPSTRPRTEHDDGGGLLLLLADLLFDLETTNAKNLAVTTELEKKSLRARIAELEAQ